MLFEHSSYRSFLKALLAEKVQKNRAFSLRALAAQLGIQSSQLSEAMSGKGNFSQAASVKIANKIGLKDDEAEYFCLMVQHEAESDLGSRELFLQKINRIRSLHVKRNLNDLNIDKFKQISEWYHSAIIELVNLDGFHCTPEAVASALSISKLDAEVALERLERLSILSRDEEGSWKRHPDDFQMRSTVPSQAMRNFYRQMLTKASDALETQTPDERLSGYETLTFSKESLKEARELYEKFLDDMARISGKSKKKTNVYHVLVHCFNLTPQAKAAAK